MWVCEWFILHTLLYKKKKLAVFDERTVWLSSLGKQTAGHKTAVSTNIKTILSKKKIDIRCREDGLIGDRLSRKFCCCCVLCKSHKNHISNSRKIFWSADWFVCENTEKVKNMTETVLFLCSSVVWTLDTSIAGCICSPVLHALVHATVLDALFLHVRAASSQALHCLL